MRTFLVVYSVLHWTIFAYLAWSLGGGVPGAVALAAPFLAIWLMPLLYWREQRRAPTPFDHGFHIVAFLSMGFVSFLGVLTIARDVLALVSPVIVPSGWVAGAAVLLNVLGVFLARKPRVQEIRIPVAGLPPELEGFKIAQISDLHAGPTISKAYVQGVVDQVNALAPDVVALTGDIADGDVGHLAPVVAPLGGLVPRGRVYFVLGNHEHYHDAPAWVAAFRELGATVLQNTGEVIEHRGARVLIAGVTDPAGARFGDKTGPDPARAAAGGEGAALRVLLAHQPGIAEKAAAAGFHLQLSGHTHGGQFFPWTLVVKMVHKYAEGLERCGAMWVYVSPGTGSWGPPVRLGTLPEVTLLTFSKDDKG